MTVRSFTVADTAALAELYRESVRGLGAQHYTPAQVDAWASSADDLEGFQTKLNYGFTLVSTEENVVAAFGELLPWDNVSLLYCAPRFARRGHATAIYAQLEAAARKRRVTHLTTTASSLARPFFEKNGFKLAEVERTEFGGAKFERYKMEKLLG